MTVIYFRDMLQNDAGTVIKCLKIFTELVSSLFLSRCNSKQHGRSTRRGVHPTILSLLETFVNPCVLNEQPEVRKEAITALGTCCMFSRQLACQNFALFMQVSRKQPVYVLDIAYFQTSLNQSQQILYFLLQSWNKTCTEPRNINN